MIIFILVLYSTLFTPVYLCFFKDFYYIKHFEIVMEIFFFIDLIFNFITSYRDHEENLVLSNKIISKEYLSTWFIYDLIFVVPFEMISLISTDDYTQTIFIYLKWFKVLRIGKIFREQSTGRFLSNVILSENYTLNRIFKFGILFIFFTHISSCFFIFIGVNSQDNYSWIVNSNIDNDYLDMYIASLYYNLVTIYSIGYGDIVPVTIKEKIWVIVFMITGSMLYSYAVSSLSNIFLEKNNKYIEYKKKQSILNSIKQEYEISTCVFFKIHNSIKQEYKNNENERYDFLETLPSKIKVDLTMVMYKSRINQLKFFNNKSSDFILYVLPMLKHENVIKGDLLVSVGDTVEEMYFVLNGCLSINMGSQFDNIEIGMIRKGNHFGDILMHLNIQSPYEIKCKRSLTELFILKKMYFQRVKNSYTTNVYDILDESSNNLILVDKNKQLYSEILRFYKNKNEVKKKMLQLNKYIFEKGFKHYYDYNLDFENPNDHVMLNHRENLKEFLDSLEENLYTINNSISNKTEKKLKTIMEEKEVNSNRRVKIYDEAETHKEDILNIKNENRDSIFLKINHNQHRKSNIPVVRNSFKDDFKSIYRQINKVFNKTNKTHFEDREKTIRTKTLDMFPHLNGKTKKKSGLDELLFNSKNVKTNNCQEKVIFKISKRNTNQHNYFSIERAVDIHLTNVKKTWGEKLSFHNFKSKMLIPVSTVRFDILPCKNDIGVILDYYSNKSNSSNVSSSQSEKDIIIIKKENNNLDYEVNKLENLEKTKNNPLDSSEDLSDVVQNNLDCFILLRIKNEENKRLGNILKTFEQLRIREIIQE